MRVDWARELIIGLIFDLAGAKEWLKGTELSNTHAMMLISVVENNSMLTTYGTVLLRVG